MCAAGHGGGSEASALLLGTSARHDLDPLGARRRGKLGSGEPTSAAPKGRSGHLQPGGRHAGRYGVVRQEMQLCLRCRRVDGNFEGNTYEAENLSDRLAVIFQE